MGDFVEIREVEDASGRRVSGEVQGMAAAAAESVAALAALTEKVKKQCEARMAEDADHVRRKKPGPPPNAAPRGTPEQEDRAAAERAAFAAAAADASAQAPEKGLGDFDALMRRLDDLEAQEAAGAGKKARARSTVTGDQWGSGFFQSKPRRAAADAPSTENAEKLRRRMRAEAAAREAGAPAARPAAAAAPAAAAPAAAAKPAAPAKPAVSWKKGFFDRAPKKQAASARRGAAPAVGAPRPATAAKPFAGCVGGVVERPDVKERPSTYAPLADELERDRPFPGPRFSSGRPVFPNQFGDARRAPKAPAPGGPDDQPKSLFASTRQAMRDCGEDPDAHRFLRR